MTGLSVVEVNIHVQGVGFRRGKGRRNPRTLKSEERHVNGDYKSGTAVFLHDRYCAFVVRGGFCLQVVPAAYVWNEFLYLSGRWETGAVALVMFLVSIQLFGLTFSSGKKTRYDKEAVVIHGAMGDVRIAIEAIKNLLIRQPGLFMGSAM